MWAQVVNTRFYYAVQVFIPDTKNSQYRKWQTVETFKEQYKAIELMQKLKEMPEMSINEIYKDKSIQPYINVQL